MMDPSWFYVFDSASESWLTDSNTLDGYSDAATFADYGAAEIAVRRAANRHPSATLIVLADHGEVE